MWKILFVVAVMSDQRPPYQVVDQLPMVFDREAACQSFVATHKTDIVKTAKAEAEKRQSIEMLSARVTCWQDTTGQPI